MQLGQISSQASPKMERSLVLIIKSISDHNTRLESFIMRLRSIADNVQGPTPKAPTESKDATAKVVDGDITNIRNLLIYQEAELLELDNQIQRLESL